MASFAISLTEVFISQSNFCWTATTLTSSAKHRIMVHCISLFFWRLSWGKLNPNMQSCDMWTEPWISRVCRAMRAWNEKEQEISSLSIWSDCTVNIPIIWAAKQYIHIKLQLRILSLSKLLVYANSVCALSTITSSINVYASNTDTPRNFFLCSGCHHSSVSLH